MTMSEQFVKTKPQNYVDLDQFFDLVTEVDPDAVLSSQEGMVKIAFSDGSEYKLDRK